MLRFFWVMVGVGKGISNDQDQLLFHVKGKAEVSKAQQHVVVGGMAALESNHQHSRRYTGELFWMDCCCSWISSAVCKFSSTSAVTVD